MNCVLQPDEGRVPAGITQHASRPPSAVRLRRTGILPHTPGSWPRGSRHSQTAFSLMEVMIASGIFFMCVFSILAMVSSVLRNARSLRRTELDAGMVAARLVGVTNRFYEGSESGDFGNLYPDYSYEADTIEAATNGLYEIDIVVRRRGVSQPVDSMSIYVFSPDSAITPGRPR
jgi:hypothetical protein